MTDLKSCSPYQGIRVPLDIERARREGKYMLIELYERLFHEKPLPKQIPTVTDYREWLKDWRPSHRNFRPGFCENFTMSDMEGRLWQLFKLETYWRLNDNRNRA